VAFSTEEGAFLRGQVRMEERVELNLEPEGETKPTEPPPPAENTTGTRGK
jgi:hypothetical protein